MQPYTAISRKVVGKSARDWSWVHCFSKKFQRMTREAVDVCLRVLKESNKRRFDSHSVTESALIISHNTFRDCRVHSFSENLFRNSCFATLLQNELNSDFAPFITHEKNPYYLICCKTGLNAGGKTRNIAIQLVLQQCCRTSCTFSVARFTVV